MDGVWVGTFQHPALSTERKEILYNFDTLTERATVECRVH
jgi:hypothetical protein